MIARPLCPGAPLSLIRASGRVFTNSTGLMIRQGSVRLIDHNFIHRSLYCFSFRPSCSWIAANNPGAALGSVDGARSRVHFNGKSKRPVSPVSSTTGFQLPTIALQVAGKAGHGYVPVSHSDSLFTRFDVFVRQKLPDTPAVDQWKLRDHTPTSTAPLEHRCREVRPSTSVIDQAVQQVIIVLRFLRARRDRSEPLIGLSGSNNAKLLTENRAVWLPIINKPNAELSRLSQNLPCDDIWGGKLQESCD